MKRMRSAANTGRRLHLDPEHVQVLLSEEVYRVMSDMEATEMRRACAGAVTNDNSVGIIGSGNDPTTGSGASAGWDGTNLDAVSRGARLRLTEAMSELQLRKRQSTH